jgi:glyceraldehyde 3-phosphate dehydrogenase
MAIRVPTPNVSVVDLVFETERSRPPTTSTRRCRPPPTARSRACCSTATRARLGDFNGNTHSSIFDATATKVLEPGFAKILSWYDNEIGFSMRLATSRASSAARSG